MKSRTSLWKNGAVLKNLNSRDGVVIHQAVKEEKMERNFYLNISFKPACHQASLVSIY